MPHRIISIRGTNGSAKTTVIKALMARSAKPVPKYGLLGVRNPEAYGLTLPDVEAPVFVLGPYETDTGGCDSIQPYDLILDLINKYIVKGHVLFEGVIVSSSYGRVGRLMETFGKENAIMAFLDTSLEDCIESVKSRRAGRYNRKELDPTNLTSKYYQIQGSRDTIKKEGKLTVIDISRNNGADEIHNLLRGA